MKRNAGWSVADLLYLKNNYPTVDTVDVCQQLNKSYVAVTLKAFSLGIKKAATYKRCRITNTSIYFKGAQ